MPKSKHKIEYVYVKTYLSTGAVDQWTPTLFDFVIQSPILDARS